MRISVTRPSDTTTPSHEPTIAVLAYAPLPQHVFLRQILALRLQVGERDQYPAVPDQPGVGVRILDVGAVGHTR